MTRPLRALALAALAAALVVPLAPRARADGPTAEELIPFEKLDVPLREELWRVTQRYTIRRAIEIQPVRCKLDTYRWLMGHLGLASVAVRKLGLGKYVIEDKPDGRFSVDDQGGAFAACERAFDESGRVVVVARGHVEGALMPRVRGTGVIVVRYRDETKDEQAEREAKGADADGKPRVLADCRVYFRVDDGFLHLASQPFRKTLGKILGEKLDGLAQCAGKVSEVVDRDPEKVLDAVQGAPSLPPEQVDEFKKKFLIH